LVAVLFDSKYVLHLSLLKSSSFGQIDSDFHKTNELIQQQTEHKTAIKFWCTPNQLGIHDKEKGDKKAKQAATRHCQVVIRDFQRLQLKSIHKVHHQTSQNSQITSTLLGAIDFKQIEATDSAIILKKQPTPCHNNVNNMKTKGVTS